MTAEPINLRQIVRAVLKGLLIFVAVLPLGLGALYLLACWLWGPPIHAVDNDPYLTSIAGSALPLIQTLGRYHDEHHHYPEEKSEIVSVTGPAQDQFKKFSGWIYLTENSDAYSLYYKLSWDPGLYYHYRYQDHKGHWEYDPGDCHPSKTIRLNP